MIESSYLTQYNRDFTSDLYKYSLNTIITRVYTLDKETVFGNILFLRQGYLKNEFSDIKDNETRKEYIKQAKKVLLEKPERKINKNMFRKRR